MPGDPNQYLDNHKEKLSEEELEVLEDFVARANIADSTMYDYLSRLRNIFKTCQPSDLEIKNPSEDQILELANNIKDEKDNPHTTKSWLKSVRKLYKVYDGGEYYEKTKCFNVSARTGTNTTVEPEMILTNPEIQEIVNNCKNVRDKAYVRLLYETASTPGELLSAKLSDVNLEEETIYVRGNKGHLSQTMELHNEGVGYLREYLESHPAVENPFRTTSDKPLWIKTGSSLCKCGQSQSKHARDSNEACDNFRLKQVEEVQYRAMNKAFKKAAERSDVDKDVKQKYLRKSMITELASDLGYEQLNNFARWKAGSNQAQHYVSLDNEEMRNTVKEKFKGGATEENLITCKNCNSRNDPERIKCKSCNRPLNVGKTEQMKRAKEVANKLSEYDDEDLDKLDKALEFMEDPEETVDKMIEEKMEKKA